jgi:hypothetical protein
MQGPGWRHFWAFSALSILLLGLVPGLAWVSGSSMDFGALAERASEETGVPWTSSLWDVGRLAVAEPGLWLLLLKFSALRSPLRYLRSIFLIFF